MPTNCLACFYRSWLSLRASRQLFQRFHILATNIPSSDLIYLSGDHLSFLKPCLQWPKEPNGHPTFDPSAACPCARGDFGRVEVAADRRDQLGDLCPPSVTLVVLGPGAAMAHGPGAGPNQAGPSFLRKVPQRHNGAAPRSFRRRAKSSLKVPNAIHVHVITEMSMSEDVDVWLQQRPSLQLGGSSTRFFKCNEPTALAKDDGIKYRFSGFTSSRGTKWEKDTTP